MNEASHADHPGIRRIAHSPQACVSSFVKACGATFTSLYTTIVHIRVCMYLYTYTYNTTGEPQFSEHSLSGCSVIQTWSLWIKILLSKLSGENFVFLRCRVWSTLFCAANSNTIHALFYPPSLWSILSTKYLGCLCDI